MYPWARKKLTDSPLDFDANFNLFGIGGEILSLSHCPMKKIPYSLKFSRGKYFAVLPNSAQKQIFMDKIFVVKLPATHYSYYEVEISREKFSRPC